MRAAILAATIAVLAACNREPRLERQAQHMLDLGKASLATPQFWESAGTLECRATRKDVCGADGCVIEKVGRVPGYSDHWIEHQPRYHVVATFTRPPRLSEVQRLAPREIRDRIEIRAAKRTREEIAVMRDDIARRLQTGRLTGWSSGYNPKTQCFEITVASVGAVTQVRTANERAADRCGRARRTSPAAALGS